MQTTYRGAVDVTGQADVTPSPDGRPLRADARRNHDQLLAAASELYAEQGVEVPLETVAKHAGVGIGTLYRHFPTRDALTEAVYRRGVDTLCDSVDELLATERSDEALRQWMRRFAAYVATKKGMGTALKSVLGADNELFTYSRRRISESLHRLVAAAVESGAVRPDTDPEDLLRGMSGICMAADSAEGEERSVRLIDLLVDGLRYRASV